MSAAYQSGIRLQPRGRSGSTDKRSSRGSQGEREREGGRERERDRERERERERGRLSGKEKRNSNEKDGKSGNLQFQHELRQEDCRSIDAQPALLTDLSTKPGVA